MDTRRIMLRLKDSEAFDSCHIGLVRPSPVDTQGAVSEARIPREFRRPYRPRRSVDVWRAATIVAFWIGLAATLLPWWLNTPSGFLRDAATSLTAVGRITGLVAGYVLLVQVLLMSRLVWLDRWLGARDLLHWHRDLGVFVVAAVVAHAVFITAGYARLERVPLPH